MMGKTGIGCAAVILIACGACVPPDGGGGSETTVRIGLNSVGVFENVLSPQSNDGNVDVADQLPATDRVGATLAIDPANVTIDLGTSGVDSATVTLLFAFAESEGEPCNEVPILTPFNVSIDSTGTISVTPESIELSESVFALVDGGAFSICIVATSSATVDFTLAEVVFTLIPPAQVAAADCSEVLALPEVQSALAVLSSNGIEFRVPTGTFDTQLAGQYLLDQNTTFDPDQTDVGDTQDGSVTLASQTTETIERRGFNAAVAFFLQGNASSAGFCALERTENTRCDQTVARLENLTLDADTGGLSGNFLAVAVRRHDFTDATCGARGDFVYGTLSLSPGGTAPSLISPRGKITLPDAFIPDLIALTSTGNSGVVTASSGLSALQFTTVNPQTTTAYPLPTDATGTRFGAIGITPDALQVALAVETPPRIFSYDNATLGLRRATEIEEPSTLAYLGGRIDFSLSADRVYVPGTDDRFADRINVVFTGASAITDFSRRLFTPNGSRPVRARLSPDGTQLAVLLQTGTAEFEAEELTFVNLAADSFVVPPIDLVASTGGTALAGELVYSADGERVFLAGLGAVLAVDTASPFNITAIDVSGVQDDPVSLALSGDGEVLAVALDDAVGNADFAVIDATTLAVLNTQDLPGIGVRRALGVAHFTDRRLALVANLESTVVAVQTEAPFTADEPVRVADVPELNALGAVTASASVAAVTNLDESTIYLFEAAQ